MSGDPGFVSYNIHYTVSAAPPKTKKEIHAQIKEYSNWTFGSGLGDYEVIDILKKPPSEEAIQETIPFEDENVVAGKKHPLLIMPSGLFVYKNEVPPEESKSHPDPEHKLVLFVPNKNKKAAKTIKMHPMTGVAIRAKTRQDIKAKIVHNRHYNTRYERPQARRQPLMSRPGVRVHFHRCACGKSWDCEKLLCSPAHHRVKPCIQCIKREQELNSGEQQTINFDPLIYAQYSDFISFSDMALADG